MFNLNYYKLIFDVIFSGIIVRIQHRIHKVYDWKPCYNFLKNYDFYLFHNLLSHTKFIFTIIYLRIIGSQQKF